ncbi:MAG TPA: hypothetical protein VKZ96_01150 [Thermomicrobiales bacterium]|nr:hypothetical protein [Thermomicrobiales bacterium]
MKRLIGIFATVATLTTLASPLFAGTAAAAPPGNAHFNAVWQRTDKPVADLLVDRTWIWGPEGRSAILSEAYAESPGGARDVQYFDKSRMELTHPDGDPNSIWYVTNGLLVVELITGRMQLGDNLFEDRLPAEVPVAGDRGDAGGPTYATFGAVLDAPATPVGEAYIERLSRSGQVTSDSDLLSRGILAAHYDEVTGHSIAAPFWDFMNSAGAVYWDGQFDDDLLFADPLFGTGRPISEAYWSEVLVAGTPVDVLMQCFERRCLTYNPANPEGWQVEAGNVGIHYYEWRYGADEDPGQMPPGEPPATPPPGPPGVPPPGDPEPGDEAPGTPRVTDALGHPGNAGEPFVLVYFDVAQSGGYPEGFRLYRRGDSGYRLVDEAEALYRYLEDTDVEHGGHYCYVMTAFNAHGESRPTDDFCVDVPYPEDEPAGPALISPAAGYVSYDREIEFVWEPVSGVNGMVLCLFKLPIGDLPCDFDLDPQDGYALWMSGADTLATGSIIRELPEQLVPDGSRLDLYWTVSACETDAYNCLDSDERRLLTVDLTAPLTAPNLRYATPDTTDPGRYTFTWDLAPGAERYIVCIYGPSGICEQETGDYLKSALLGSTVDSYVLTIPVWLAPDGRVTELRWTVAACDAALNCVWSQQVRTIYVDRTPEADLEPVSLTGVTADPNNPARLTFTWLPSAGAERYIICLISANTGGHCKWETGDLYRSEVLGPTVTSHTMEIPNWLAPDGAQTILFAQVGACDINLACAWPGGYFTVIVDRT